MSIIKKNELVIEKNICTEKGITLISLIVTIIVMLILASVTVNVVIDGGLFKKAGHVKNNMEITSEKEIIQKAMIYVKTLSKTGKITKDELQKSMDKIEGENIIKVIDEVGTLIIKFNKSNRYYEIGNNENVDYLGNLKEKELLIQCTNSTGEPITTKKYTIVKNKYSIILPKVEGYEATVEKIEGEITNNITINQLYYKVFNDDTTLFFTGLDVNGNKTTDEASIVSYMVGDGTTTNGNGLKEKKEPGIVSLPDTYKGKKVEIIGTYAFADYTNIKKVRTGDNVKAIQGYAFRWCYGIDEIVIGKNVSKLGDSPFQSCGLRKLTIKTENIIFSGGQFNLCSNFTEMEVNSDNKTYKVVDNILYSKDGKILYLFPSGKKGEVIVPKEVTYIHNSVAEYNGGLNKLVISDDVTTIGRMAFYNSKVLKEVVIGKNVTSIGDGAFQNCSQLKTVTIDSNTIAEKITTKTACSYLVNASETIYIKEGIIPGSYITANFTAEESDKTGYIKYVKNS